MHIACRLASVCDRRKMVRLSGDRNGDGGHRHSLIHFTAGTRIPMGPRTDHHDVIPGMDAASPRQRVSDTVIYMHMTRQKNDVPRIEM